MEFPGKLLLYIKWNIIRV